MPGFGEDARLPENRRALHAVAVSGQADQVNGLDGQRAPDATTKRTQGEFVVER